jgi:hypothetical protein
MALLVRLTFKLASSGTTRQNVTDSLASVLKPRGQCMYFWRYHIGDRVRCEALMLLTPRRPDCLIAGLLVGFP